MSPRPKKPRNCNCPHRPPGCAVFKPAGIPLKDLEHCTLALDELEALRLCDAEGLTQEQAGVQMNVSRGTVQRLVTRGRKTLIDAVLQGLALVVESSPNEKAEDPKNAADK